MNLRADIAVVGASLGGVLAAWRAAQAGLRVVLLAEHRWLGGQMTAQGVPPDEHARIEEGGASASYRAFRQDIRAHYAQQPGFRDIARPPERLNPGDGWVSRLCFEPAVAAQWFEALLAPQVAAGRLHIVRGARVQAADVQGGQVLRVHAAGCSLDEPGLPEGAADSTGRGGYGGHGRAGPGWDIGCEAAVFIDATDTGELLALAGLDWRVGKEARSAFGEPDAPERADPLDQQPITHVFALRESAAAQPVGPPPPGYDFWRDRVVPHFGHRLFSEYLPDSGGLSRRLPLRAVGDELDWWDYRRIVCAAHWQPARAEVTLVNWPQNDYALHPPIDGPRTAQEVMAGARGLSLALLHWLRTEAPRPDGGTGWPEWEAAPDILGTADGLAMQPYVRESRRIVARDTLTQVALMREPTGRADSVGIGWYNLDIHPTCVSGHGTNAHVHPFELPLGAFVPAAGGNVVPGCKNIGVTHLANACTRVHPVEWLVGEVAGVLAVMRLREGWPDRPAQREALRARLRTLGVPLHWEARLLRQPAGAGAGAA